MYSVALCIHVIAAVFGAGQVATIFVVASSARRGVAATEAAAIVRRILPLTMRGLVALFISGVALDFTVGRAYDHAVWFRASVLLLLVLGALLGVARRALRAPGAEEASALRRVERLSVGMWLIVGAAVVLMELKP